MKQLKSLFVLALSFALLLSVMSVPSEAADIDPPELDSISFDKDSGTPGEIVEILIDAHDDDSGVEWVQCQIFNPDNNFAAHIDMNYDDVSELWEGIFTVNEYWQIGTYYVHHVFLEDYAGNLVYLYNGTDFTSPTVEISGTTPDPNPPVLHFMYFNVLYTTVNQTVQIRANLSDDISGIDYVIVAVSNPYGNIVAWPSLYYNDPLDLWVGEFVIEPYCEGSCYMHYIYVVDFADNHATYYNGTDFWSASLNVLDAFGDEDTDGLPNWWEITHSLDPYDGDDAATDNDGDGLNNTMELCANTDPWDYDTDDDNLSDGDEVNSYGTDPLNPDTDGDGLNDDQEVFTDGIDPLDWDSDDDRLGDGEELNDYGTDPTKPDTDEDGLTDGDEVYDYGTDPNWWDSDNDTFSDGDEVAAGTDPLDENDYPAVTTTTPTTSEDPTTTSEDPTTTSEDPTTTSEDPTTTGDDPSPEPLVPFSWLGMILGICGLMLVVQHSRRR